MTIRDMGTYRQQGSRERGRGAAASAVALSLLFLVVFAVAEFAEAQTTNLVAAAIILAFAVVMAFLGIKRIDLLLLAVIGLAPFHSLVRGLSPDSVLLSGWRDILYVYTILVWLGWVVLGKLKMPSGWPPYVILLLNVVGMCEAARSPSFLAGLASFRDVIKYAMLVFVAEGLCRRYPWYLKRIAVVMFASAAFVTVVQVILYAADMDYVVRMGASRPVNWRSLDLIQIRRMEAFFGGGPSNLGIYLAAALTIYLVYRLSKERVPLWWNFAAALEAVALVMTISFSAIVAVFFSLLLLLSRKGVKRLHLVPIGVAVVILFLVANAGLTPEMFRVDSIKNPTFFTYFSVIFFQRLFLGYAAQTIASPATFLMGTGLGIVGNKSFLVDAPNSGLRVIGDSDGGWAEFALQVGVPMVLLVVVTIILVLRGAYRTIRFFPPEQRNAIWAILGACIAMLTSIHIVPWIRVGPDVDFWIVLGALMYVATHGANLRRLAAREKRRPDGAASP